MRYGVIECVYRKTSALYQAVKIFSVRVFSSGIEFCVGKTLASNYTKPVSTYQLQSGFSKGENSENLMTHSHAY
jgi:hypothetical protein